MVNTLIHCDITKLKDILQQNMFPPKLIDEQINTFLHKNMAEDPVNRNFYKLPKNKRNKETNL